MAPPPRRFLTATQIKRLHIMFVANVPPSRLALLESTISTFIKTAHSKEHEKQRDPFQLAAILAKQMMENRAFADGNKSTALLAANTFIILNGYMHANRWGMWLMTPEPLGPDRTKSLANAHVKVARGEWSARELGSYYKKAAEDPISVSAYAPEWNEEEQEYLYPPDPPPMETMERVWRKRNWQDPVWGFLDYTKIRKVEREHAELSFPFVQSSQGAALICAGNVGAQALVYGSFQTLVLQTNLHRREQKKNAPSPEINSDLQSSVYSIAIVYVGDHGVWNKIASPMPVSETYPPLRGSNGIC